MGHTRAACLGAFNSGDVGRMYEFADRYKDPMKRWIANLREETGAFNVVAIEKSDPRSITFVVQEKASTAQTIGFLRVANGDPAVIETFTLVAGKTSPPRGPATAVVDVGAATRSRD